MKRTLIALLAATTMTAAIPAIASAQPGWMSVNERQANLDARIEAGVRSGQVTRDEAVRLRAEFNGIASLEGQYRASAPGLTNAERADLDRRFDVLSGRIQIARNDVDPRWNPGAWENINARQIRLDARIDRAQRDGRLTRREARGLRSDFRYIARLEAQYRASRPGLTVAERADLDRRFDVLSARIHDESTDRQYGYGYGRGR
jgi:hypothetical protein